ncbi:MAG TPA: spore germination protein [Ruminococcaceae bacterium]|nr:spore germination protein [Oscillospiraceae bacterium]HCU32484.1 spore germination protein [Oscillospiraceae bacterium]
MKSPKGGFWVLEKILGILQPEKSFDLVCRNTEIAGRRCALLFVDGMIKDEVMEKMLEYFLKLAPSVWEDVPDMQSFARRIIPYVEVADEDRLEAACTAILSGNLGLFIEGFSACALVDVRTYPVRGVEEPEKDKVLRGSRDGFVETVVFNTALIRRRIRDPKLVMSIQSAGESSHTDIVVCYMEDRADLELVGRIKERISHIQVQGLTMSQESLAEALISTKWHNPFPKTRYTERPDTASAALLEGRIVVLVDNSPSAMILPSGIFDFFREADDYYFPPITGTYLRITRIVIFLLTLFLTPVWLLLVEHPQWIPPWLAFIGVSEPNGVPILAQLLVLEFAVDGLRMASTNTPSIMSNSLGIIGALLLGDFAVQSGWFVPETILYAAFTAIANYAQPSLELGFAFKFARLGLLILTGCFGLWGFLGGTVLFLIILCSTRTLSGKSYLYPLIPFNARDFKRVFVRRKLENR